MLIYPDSNRDVNMKCRTASPIIGLTIYLVSFLFSKLIFVNKFTIYSVTPSVKTPYSTTLCLNTTVLLPINPRSTSCKGTQPVYCKWYFQHSIITITQSRVSCKYDRLQLIFTSRLRNAVRRLYKHNEQHLLAAMCRAAMKLQADAVSITAYSCMPPLAQSERDQRIRYDNEP